MDNELGYLEKVKEWLVVSGIDFLANVIAFIIILIIGKIIISIACNVTKKTLDKSSRVSDMLQGFAVNVVSKVLWVIILMIALQRLGIDIAPLIAGLGVTGFIVGFAFQESLGNLASGLMIALNQPFKVGDFVETGGICGEIKELNMMATTMTTLDNKKVVVPNKSVWGSAITNYTALDKRRVDLGVGISYGSDIGKAKGVITEALKTIAEILPEPVPDVEVLEMADSSVNLVVRPWCKTDDYWTVYFKTNQAVKEALDREKVEIPFPQLDVHHYQLPENQKKSS